MKTKIKNTLPPESSIYRLAADLQDMWHYALLLNPSVAPGQDSTFLGESEYSGLRGQLDCYENLVNRVSCWQYSELPSFANLSLCPMLYIKDLPQLRYNARQAFKAVCAVAADLAIDAHAGMTLAEIERENIRREARLSTVGGAL
jgi:hypothetical protein